MKFGLGHLRLSPPAFWRMSLLEYDAALRGYLEAKGVKRNPTMRRAELQALMAQFPDTPNPQAS